MAGLARQHLDVTKSFTKQEDNALKRVHREVYTLLIMCMSIILFAEFDSFRLWIDSLGFHNTKIHGPWTIISAYI